MTSKHPNLCDSCKHYAGDGTCVAFPEAIPDDILLLAGDHREHVPGDNGIVFSLRRNAKAIENLEDWKRNNLQ